jgi:hypothetical protein
LRGEGQTSLGQFEAVSNPYDRSVLKGKAAAEIEEAVGLLLAATGVKEGSLLLGQGVVCPTNAAAGGLRRLR